ncbi:MAG: hypothetical protein ACREUU_03055 [Gammaproteobacteria bacterium]
MPTELRLRFTKLDKDAPFDAPVPVSVHFEGAEAESFNFLNPLTDPDLRDIRWYLERYWQWPVGPDYDRAQENRGQIAAKGQGAV